MIPFNSITLSSCILDSRLVGKSVFLDRFDQIEDEIFFDTEK